jgi:SRP-independent targeting protein 2/TMEM208
LELCVAFFFAQLCHPSFKLLISPFCFASFNFLSKAKEASEQVYRPLLLGINVVYLLLVFGRRLRGSNTLLPYGLWGCLGMMATWGLQLYAYMGIVEQSQNQIKQKKGELAGGVYLDLLGLTVLVQFASALHSTKWFWLLISAPIYALYKLYTTFYGSGKTASQPTTDDNDDPNAAAQQERRQKRAERRKQKWG